MKNTQLLPGTSDGLQSEWVVDLATKKGRSEALITSFMVEHSLPFSIAPNILDLAKTLSKDLPSLKSVQMSRSSAKVWPCQNCEARTFLYILSY